MRVNPPEEVLDSVCDDSLRRQWIVVAEAEFIEIKLVVESRPFSVDTTPAPFYM